MFIFSPSEAEKQPRVQKIVFVTGKMTNVMEYITFLILPHIRQVPAQCGATNVVSTNAISTNVPLIGYLEQIFLFLRGKLGEMMTLFHTVAFCGHL